MLLEDNIEATRHIKHGSQSHPGFLYPIITTLVCTNLSQLGAKAVAGLAPVKRNRFIRLDGAAKSVNRELEDKARTLAGIKGYKSNLAATRTGSLSPRTS